MRPHGQALKAYTGTLALIGGVIAIGLSAFVFGMPGFFGASMVSVFVGCAVAFRNDERG